MIMDIGKKKMRLACKTAYCLTSVLWIWTCQNAVATDSLLPNGTNFIFWEQPLTFSKTYYVDNNSAKADDNGPGTRSIVRTRLPT